MESFIQPLVNAGAVGVFALYLIWREGKDRELAREQIAAQLALAKALVALTVIITGKAE